MVNDLLDAQVNLTFIIIIYYFVRHQQTILFNIELSVFSKNSPITYGYGHSLGSKISRRPTLVSDSKGWLLNMLDQCFDTLDALQTSFVNFFQCTLLRYTCAIDNWVLFISFNYQDRIAVPLYYWFYFIFTLYFSLIKHISHLNYPDIFC